jgi:hypothetical protein
MKSQYRKWTGTLYTGALLLAGLACAPPSNPQRFSDWSSPVNLGPLVNSGFDDQHPAISRDGLRLYFSSNRPGGFGGLDIWVARRASLQAPWEAPINLGPNINTRSDDFAPNFSNDERLLFFHSVRPGGCGMSDLYFSRRDKFDDFGWEPALNLDFFGRDPNAPLVCIVNSAFNDGGPDYFQDDTGRTDLYFTSTRPGGLGDFDIYATTLRADGTWGLAALVPELSSPNRDTRTAIRRHDGLEMILSTERPGSRGRDLWTSTRATTQDLWSAPVNLGPTINSAGSDGAPALSWDGTTLFFFSARPGGFGANDLYMSTRTKLTGPNRDK